MTRRRDAPQRINGDDKIVVLASVDAAVVGELSAQLHALCVGAPLQVIVASCVLYQILGASGFIGIITLLSLLPIQHLLSNIRLLPEVRRSKQQAVVDIWSIRSSPVFVSSSIMFGNVSSEIELPDRDTELESLRDMFSYWVAYAPGSASASLMALFVTLINYTLVAGHSLRSSAALPTLMALSILRRSLSRASNVATLALQIKDNKSLYKIKQFFGVDNANRAPQLPRAVDHVVGFVDATLEWLHDDQEHELTHQAPLRSHLIPAPFRLRNLEVKFVSRGFNVIAGRRGSGKSSVLLTLLGEMKLVAGCLYPPANSGGLSTTTPSSDPFGLCKAAAYCPAQPCIRNETIRTNVTFGLPFHYERYKTALDAVAILPELPNLIRGDLTMAGENGRHLTPSMRQRIALARALYSRAQCVLLDDVLSGLDAPIVRRFVDATKGELMRGRTLVMASQQIRMLTPHCDFVVFMDGGKVACQGSPTELVAARYISSDYLVRPMTPCSSLTPRYQNKKPKDKAKDDSFVLKNFSKAPTMREREEEALRQLEENDAAAIISWSSAKFYLQSTGRRRWLIITAVFVTQQLLGVGINLWMEQWARERSTPLLRGPATCYAAFYLVILIAYIFSSCARYTMAFQGILEASRTIHERLLDRILHAKLGRLDSTPMKHFMARFGKDMQILDLDLAFIVVSALNFLSSLITTTALMSVVLPAFLFVAVLVGLSYAACATAYIRTSYQLKTLMATEKERFLQKMKEALTGSISIRAYSQVDAFIVRGFELVDDNSRIRIFQSGAKAWLAMCVNSLGALLSSATGALVFWNMGPSGVGAGLAGLVLALSLIISEDVLALIELCAQGLQGLDSVERIRNYTEIEQEPTEAIRQLQEPMYSWPQRSSIRFRDYSSRFGPRQGTALKQLNLSIQGGQRVAVVGSQGRDESSLVMALIRKVEASEGRIEIDGVNIASLRLDVLRWLVAILPSNLTPPPLGHSVRKNLDPELAHSDEQIYEVIQSLGLTKIMPTDLDAVLPALTVSQRQLLCVGNVLLRKPLVIVMDQVIDNMDESDKLVQKILHDGIAAGTTVVTLTDRLTSIADYDQVIVMSDGSVVEEGSPERLLDKDTKSDATAVFKRMCLATSDFSLIHQTAGQRTSWILSLYEPALGIWSGTRGHRITEPHNWSRYKYDLDGIM